MNKKPIPNEALVASVYELGRPTTPEELTRRGIRRLRSVGMAEVSRLIEQAVNRTLMERTIDVSPAEMDSLLAEAQSKMADLVQGRREIEDSRDELLQRRRELQKELATLQGERARSESLDEGVAHDEALFEQALDRELAGLGLGAAGAAVRARVLRALHAARVDSRARNQRIELLERRIVKLVAALENAERALMHLSALKDVDLGIASLYRVVQGISELDPVFQAKRAMMTRIFEANLALQRQTAAAAS